MNDIMHAMDDENNPFIFNSDKTPLYERPGRLDPDRNVPVTRRDRVDVNIHYDEGSKTFIKDSDTPEFTEQSVNALDPFEDTALLNGEVKPKVVGIRSGMRKVESKIFMPETDTEGITGGVRKPVVNVTEPEQPLYIAEEDAAASSDFIADAFSGVDTVEKSENVKTVQPSDDITKLKLYTLLLGVVIVLEITGIAIVAIL